MNKKLIFIFLIFFILFLTLLAQDDFEKHRTIAIQYIYNSNYLRALEILHSYLKKHPDNIAVYKEIAEVNITIREYDDAQYIYEKGINLFKERKEQQKANELSYLLGKLFYATGKYNNCIINLERLVKNCDAELIKVKYDDSYQILGIANFLRSDYDAAIDFFKQYIKYHYDDEKSYKYLSEAFRNKNNKKMSDAYLQIYDFLMNNRKVKEHDFYYKKGIILLKYDNYEDGLKILLKIYQNRCREYKINFNIGLAYLLISEYDEAVLYLRKCLSLYDKKFRFSKLIKMDQLGAKYCLVLSMAYLLDKDKKKANEIFEQVKDFDRALYNDYLYDYQKGKNSKLYKELKYIWEN